MQYIRLDLNGIYREIGAQVQGLSAASMQHVFRMDHFLEQTDRILNKKKLGRVLIVRGPYFSAPPFGALEAIRDELQRLVKAGKELVYYAADYSYADSYLASVCKERILHPLGSISFLGLSSNGFFFKKLLQKQDISVEIIRRGRYKSAADAFSSDKYDKYNKEQMQRLLDTTLEYLKAGTMECSAFTPEIMEKLLSGSILSASEAVDKKLASRTAILEDLLAEWEEQKIKELKKLPIKGSWGKGKKLALLVFEGGIIDGESRNDPLMGQMIGDEAFIKAIQEVRKNKAFKAVLLRINSGGGSALASDNIVHELDRLAKEKPLVISMGPVAGSGGYWIASSGKKLFAQHTSITGSIGVLSLYFQIQKLLEKHGITADTLKNGISADMGSALRPMTRQEKTELENRVEVLYQDFLKRAAVFRSTTTEKVHELAEGRLWLGSDAKEKNLIDETGGLREAIAYLMKELGYTRARISTGPHIKQPLIARLLSRKNNSAISAAILQTESDKIQAAAILSSCRSMHGKAICMDGACTSIAAASPHIYHI